MSLVVAPESTGVSFEPRPAMSLFIHNLEAAAFLWSAVLTLGVSSAGGVLLNGYAVGAGLVVPDVPLATRLALFVPHALLELPALWLAGAAGFRDSGGSSPLPRGRDRPPGPRRGHTRHAHSRRLVGRAGPRRRSRRVRNHAGSRATGGVSRRERGN
ncbi:MAG: stage II sporulation protein M [Halococcoides sp.]